MRAISRLVVTVLGCSICGACALAQPERHHAHAAATPHVASGEILMKVTPETAHAIEASRTAGTLPQMGINSLDALCVRYGVTAMQLVFGRIYRLEFRAGADLQDVVQAFSADPHVEYAQPNYRATTNTPQGAP